MAWKRIKAATAIWFCISLFSTSALAEEPRPFFNEFQLDGGAGGTVITRSIAPTFGGTFTSGLDFGPAALEYGLKILYGPIVFGTGATSASRFGLLEGFMGMRIFSKKVAYRIGFAIAGYGTDFVGSGWGVGPTLGILYMTSRDYPIYAGFGFDVQGIFVQTVGNRNFGADIVLTAAASIYFGVRLTVFQKIMSRRY